MIRSADKDSDSLIAGFEGPSCEDVGLLNARCSWNTNVR